MTDRLRQFRATLSYYRPHGWQLARVLMTPETLAELRRETGGGAGAKADEEGAKAGDDAEGEGADVKDDGGGGLTFENVAARESDFDAMWFRRSSGGGREAWELRLAAEPYALFELFEADEPEEDREDVRREMEARLREYAAPRG